MGITPAAAGGIGHMRVNISAITDATVTVTVGTIGTATVAETGTVAETEIVTATKDGCVH